MSRARTLRNGDCKRTVQVGTGKQATQEEQWTSEIDNTWIKEHGDETILSEYK